jgi:hypothetical protein
MARFYGALRKAQTEIAVMVEFIVTCGLPKLSQKGRKAKIIYG